ncbi:MAG: amino acid adenylation domain-containing protein, partial [Clostridiaceae bacterium]|nr:amino acid adenylation domain-containing protein [Clostridiaceae bacterium]
RPFDLSEAPLLRVELVKTSENKYLLFFDMHHIISDGMSITILVDEMSRIYEGREPAPLRIQYKDYANWQNELLKSGKMKKHEEYWTGIFKDDIPVLNMPTDFPRPAVQSFNGRTVYFNAGEELTRGIYSLVGSSGTTLYNVLLAAYNVLLFKYTGQEDIVVGSPVAGRNHIELQNMLGMFVNTIVLRNYPEKERTFKDFLKKVAGNTVQAMENQDYQFEELVDRLNIKRDTGRNPLFDTMFNINDVDVPQISLGDVKLFPYPMENRISKFDFSLDVYEDPKDIKFSIEYCESLFRHDTIERLASHYLKAVEEIVENPDIRLKDISILTDAQMKELIFNFNNTDKPYNREISFIDKFEEQVKKLPGKTALICGDTKMSYSELSKRVNAVAAGLDLSGFDKDPIVAIMVERSVEMIIGLFGVLKSGGAYLPIDVDYPKDRINYMLKDSKAGILLTKKHLAESVEFDGRIICLDEEEIYSNSPSYVENKAEPDKLAYIIYTSGSTGKPKGVMIENRNMWAYINAFLEEFKLGESDVVLQQASFCFDAFVEEVYPVMSVGGTLVIPTRDEIIDTEILSRVINENKVTLISCSPLLLNELNKRSPLKSIHTFISGGDVLKKEYISNLSGYAAVYNTYGPTETTVCATYYRYDGQCDGNVPIGKPVSNYKVYILDDKGGLLPVGVPGELCISGPGVARGYLFREELTDEKFVANPFIPGEKMYRSGDLARWLPDGNIEFLGRIDFQVKIRGYRIELGEIENKLTDHPGISEAVLLVYDKSQEEKYLCAYYVSEEEYSVQELKAFLSKDLPEYMIP